ncbi:MAG: DUF1566 domain-containing protein [Candidatus Electrothrix scaldis]|nr:MAG: DUF1566 domain-containing protein [Candidatus Electrothrix sp. GW3-3]
MKYLWQMIQFLRAEDMRKIILLASLVAGGVAFSATAYANNWLLYLPAILAGSGGTTTTPPSTDTSNKWLLFLPAILSGAQNNTTVVTEAPFNDTGIVLNSSQVACGTGDKEDCNYGRDADSATNSDSDGHAGFSFTKLDSSGNEGTNLDGTWDCVRDEVTGLVWTDQPTWSVADKKSWSDAQQVYAASYSNCGFSSDWRVPTLKELMSIVAYNLSTQSVDTDYFHLPELPVFWTAIENQSDSTSAWNIDFNGGFLDRASYKESSLYVRLVHGTVKTADFTDNGNGTVTDAATGLIWKKCMEGYSGSNCETETSPTTFTWSEALNLDDGEWRLPNIKELQSLVEYQNVSPAINTEIFPGTPADSTVWSNSPKSGVTDRAWYVNFSTGGTFYAENVSTVKKYVRLVKDTSATQ